MEVKPQGGSDCVRGDAFETGGRSSSVRRTMARAACNCVHQDIWGIGRGC